MADPQLGIFGVDLATLKPFDVRVPLKLSLEGISALTWSDGALIAVQASMIPKRVMPFELSAEGNAIAKVQPLEASHPRFGTPGSATMDGTTLFVIANQQKDNYDRFGLLRSKEKLEGTKIIKINANPPPADPSGLGPVKFEEE